MDGHIFEASLKLDCRGISGKQNLNAVVLQLLLDLRGIIHNQGSVTMDEAPREIGDTVELEEQLIMVHHLEQNHLMMVIAQPVQHRLQLRDVREKVAEDHDDLAAT